MIVDAHQHLWDPARRAYPWMDGQALAPLRRAFSAEEFAAAASPAGVTATVLVQAVGAAEETVELLAAAADSALIRGVVGWVDLTRPDVGDQVAQLTEAAGGERLVGVRHQVEDEADPEWLGRADVRRGLTAVADAGLAYDLLLVRDQLPAATAAAAALPQLRLVLDHGAKPAIAAGQWEPWHSRLAALARHEHVHCKLSGLVTEADWDAWQPQEVLRYARALLEVFGPQRLMFGSDWPVCTLAASYEQVLELALRALEGCSASEQAAVMGVNATAFYRLTRE